MTVRVYLYDAHGPDRPVDLTRELVTGLGESHLLWVDVAGDDAGELERVAETLGLKPDVLQRVHQDGQRPFLEQYSHSFHLQVIGVAQQNQRYVPTVLDLIVDQRYVVTVHRDEVAFLEEFRDQVKDDSQIGQLSAAAFLAVLLGMHLTSYFRALEALEAEIDRLDEQALGRRGHRKMLNTLVRLRRRVTRLRRVLTPHREVYTRLSRPDIAVLAQGEMTSQFEALSEQLERAIESIETARDMVVGSFEVLVAHTAQDTNDFMKMLTFVTLVLGVLALIAGLLGMNFELDVYQSGTAGFIAVVVGMVVLVALALGFARWQEWI